WVDWAHFAQVAAGAAAAAYVLTMDKSSIAQIVAVGSGLSPALAANSCIGGHPGERLRVVFKAGGGTTAGAIQTIQVMAVNVFIKA
ncbi:MAG TPA: hypothetical protein VF316_25325, partial [Polyangiaceae bacterium]